MRALFRVAVAFLFSASPLFAASSDVVVAIRDGRVTVIAKNATVSEILAAWARTGLTTIVNGDKLTGVRVTLELADVPERQALDVILQSASGYIAHLRPALIANASQFDRVAIMPSSVAPRESGASSILPFQQPPQSIFQQNGVQRLIGPDGVPVADDQDDVPPPGRVAAPPGYQPRDAPPRAPDSSRSPPGWAVPALPPPATGGAPVSGVAVPGMMVPVPQPLQPQVPPSAQR